MIDRFREQNFFLSNMSPSLIILGKVKYSCAEAAFQAAKLQDKSQRKMFEGISGKEAKSIGRKINLRPDWDDIKIDVMRWIISEKFKQNPALKKRLLETGSEILIEGNNWGDRFWGVCNGTGQNWLGKILMEEREKGE